MLYNLLTLYLGLDEADKRRYCNRLCRDNVAQIVELDVLNPSAVPPHYSAQQKRITVVNTHLYSNQKHPDVKLWQVWKLLINIQVYFAIF